MNWVEAHKRWACGNSSRAFSVPALFPQQNLARKNPQSSGRKCQKTALALTAPRSCNSSVRHHRIDKRFVFSLCKHMYIYIYIYINVSSTSGLNSHVFPKRGFACSKSWLACVLHHHFRTHVKALLHHPSLKIVFILLSLPKWKQILMSFACAPDDSLGGSVIVQAAKMPTRTDREPIPINATRQPCDQSGQVWIDPNSPNTFQIPGA